MHLLNVLYLNSGFEGPRDSPACKTFWLHVMTIKNAHDYIDLFDTFRSLLRSYHSQLKDLHRLELLYIVKKVVIATFLALIHLLRFSFCSRSSYSYHWRILHCYTRPLISFCSNRNTLLRKRILRIGISGSKNQAARHFLFI